MGGAKVCKINYQYLFLLCLSSLSLADSDSEQLSLLLELELLESDELSEVGSPSLCDKSTLSAMATTSGLFSYHNVYDDLS